MISGGYYKQDGLVPTQNYEKFSFHTNLRHRFNKWLTVGTNLQYTYAIRNDQDNALGNVPRYGWPTDMPTDANGHYAVPDNPYVTDAWNPLQDFSNETHRVTTNRILFNTFADMKLADHLTYRLSIGQDIKNGRGYEFYTSQTVANQSKNANGNGSHSWYKNSSKVMENVLTYSNQWDKHRFTATGVYSWQDFVYENLGISASGFGMDVTGAWDIEQAERSSLNPNSTKYGNKLISFTGRVTYADVRKQVFVVKGTARKGTNETYMEFVPADKGRFPGSKGWQCCTPGNGKYYDFTTSASLLMSANNFMLLRYSEVLLNYAEALNHLNGGSGDALDCLNDVHERAGLAAYDAMSQSELDEAIFRERGWEFIGEGKLSFDELRTDRLGKNVYDFIARGVAEGMNYFRPLNFVPQKTFLWKIPQGDLDSNPLLEQNPDNISDPRYPLAN